MITPKTIAIIVGAALAAGIAYYLYNSSPNRTYSRAGRMHKRGELYYQEGDVELAQEYYAEAERLRDKARGLA